MNQWELSFIEIGGSVPRLSREQQVHFQFFWLVRGREWE